MTKTVTLTLDEYFELIYRSYMEGYNDANGSSKPIPQPFKGICEDMIEKSSK